MDSVLSRLKNKMRDFAELEQLVRLIFTQLQEKQALELTGKSLEAIQNEQAIQESLSELWSRYMMDSTPEELRKVVWEICLADIRQGRMNK